MDIFEYIDRVKSNFDKKPEPRYNMKKYFMGGLATPKRGLVDGPGSYAGFKQITDKEFLQLYDKFQKLNENTGTDEKFAEFLNNKKIKTSSNEKFKSTSVNSRRLRLDKQSPLGKTRKFVRKEQVDKTTDLLTKAIAEANGKDKFVSQNEISFKVEEQLGKKPQISKGTRIPRYKGSR